MQLSGEALIAAPRDAVWAALNDPAILARCIEGVQSLEPDGENRFRGTLDARVGPVRARFTGTVALTEVDAPNRYVLLGEGKGGVAGFARGSAEVRLEDTPDGGTRLSWAATSQVGGKLAQLGARLVEGAARGYAESFFLNFREIVEQPPAPAGSALPAPAQAERPAAPQAAPAGEGSRPAGLPPLFWASLLVVSILLLLFFLLSG